MTAGDGEFDDPAFLARLRAGDGAAYRRLIRRFHGTLVGTATGIIGSRAQAEEVVQDAWLAVFAGIGKFEGRSSLASWLFAIVLNRARTRASREGRLVPLPAVEAADAGERAVPLERFQPDGHWTEPPRLWDELDPERLVGGRQLLAHVREAIEKLPPGQRAVLILRDLEAQSAEEACALLGISAENQRVLLHRARGRVRRSIELLLEDAAPAAALASPRPAGPAAKPIRRGAALRFLARLFRRRMPARRMAWTRRSEPASGPGRRTSSWRPISMRSATPGAMSWWTAASWPMRPRAPIMAQFKSPWAPRF